MAKSGAFRSGNTVIGVDLGYLNSHGAWILGEIMPDGALQILETGNFKPGEGPETAEEVVENIRAKWLDKWPKSVLGPKAKGAPAEFQRAYLTDGTEEHD